MKRNLACVLAVLFGLLMLDAAWAGPGDDVKLESLTQDGYTIKYDKADEDLAKQLLPEIVKRAANQGPSEVEFLKGKRSELLAAIAAEIGMGKPTKQMGTTFDDCVEGFAPVNDLFRKVRTYELKHADSVEVSFSWRAATKTHTCSIRTGDEIEQIDLDKLDRIPLSTKRTGAGTDMEKMRSSLDAMFAQTLASTVCHEVAELTLITNLKLQGPFIRWFTDGSAHYITAKVIGKYLGKAALDKFLESTDAGKASTLAPRADLLAWRSVSWEEDMPKIDHDVAVACYALAYKEIAALVKQHGEDTLKRVCREVTASKDKVHDEQTIMDAIFKVTGEDMRAVLAKYGAKSEDKFRGIAIRDFACKSFTAKGKTADLGESTTTMKLIDDGQRGLVLIFAATTDRPATFDAYFMQTPDIACGIATQTISPKRGDPQMVTMFITCSDLFGYGPGEYPIEIRVDNKALKEIKIKLVK